MDDYEATRIVFSRIQSLDPENASRIMGLLLLQDHAEKEMIRLAFGPEALVHSVILKAKRELSLSLPNLSSSSTSPPTPSTPSSPSPFLPNPRQSSFSSRVFSANIPPLTIPNSSSSSSSSPDLPSGDTLVSPSKGGGSSLNPASLPFYGNGGGASCDVMDDFTLQEQLSFLNDNKSNMNPSINLVSPRNSSEQPFYYQQPDLSSSPPARNGNTNADPILFPHYWGSGSLHRRSFSVSDVLPSEDSVSGLGGWRPCLYYARGYCKNGSSCRFVHGDQAGGFENGSPNKIEMMEQCHEILRSKSASHHQRFPSASQLMGGSSFPYPPKGINFLLQQQQNETQRAAAAAAALMMDEDLHKFERSRLERSDYSAAAMASPASRQIYLTFPADSTFKEEDVSNYFSMYGPVQDVRIPYQQKRMFGFVTFVYPETVKTILAKGNPHFVCDARVLVKPYKEKGKVPDKYRSKQLLDRVELLSPCGTPTALDSRDPFDLSLGARIFYNNNSQDIWRRKHEEQALELQSRRLMNLQILDVKKHNHHRTLSTGNSLHPPSLFNQSLPLSPFSRGQEPLPLGSMNSSSEINGFCSEESSDHGNGKESPAESLEHNLPDSLFASPTKASFAGKFLSPFSAGDNNESQDDNNNKDLYSSSCVSSNSNSAIDMASFKSYNCQMPRFSSGHGAIGMYTGNGGPTCPVGI
ncbi:PREDICTED: zinc finger CCCH domain-containing protein 46-like [Tarenaya hassleriana]|uniref:zinc finger CCCH domain-containing protein 46-like n=1 Tax=Tarenaya hassleriana TaxID=28532 RepID=UPI00053C76FB|nr:PREDICTED: zinc finger CCCH domain-containing protein 46-like [Tarenaya hassleriana]XP_010547312.1 PREDICTED: zinc finger CCCH domain-containing protein 46-like [Tarenaya hassleriana]XP_010547313.1 PREDICTED: zinc finger CCCH domain-containing protein 46-like [Tarenaya hassleriana]XP_010547315.1 PREDICTED: zinc finger CCCH domain-containing protein 46-like [Tarenaya hassleriana]